MIKAEILYKGKGLQRLTVKGHAETAEYGHDLVCAAVSAVTIGALNALEETDSYKIEIEEGYVDVETDEKLSEHDSIVFETLIMQLKTIETANSKAVSIKERKIEQ